MSGSHGTSSHFKIYYMHIHIRIFHLTIEWMNEKSSGENHMDLTSGRMNGWGGVGGGVAYCKITSMKNRQVWMYLCRHVHILLPFLHVYSTNTFAASLFQACKNEKFNFVKKKLLCMQIFLGAANLNIFVQGKGRMNEGKWRERKMREKWDRLRAVMWIFRANCDVF